MIFQSSIIFQHCKWRGLRMGKQCGAQRCLLQISYNKNGKSVEDTEKMYLGAF